MSRSVLASAFLLIGCSVTHAAPDSASVDAVVDGASPLDANEGATDDAALVDAHREDAGPGPCGHRTASGSSAVAYQVDTAHTGAQLGDSIHMPLCRRWTADLHGEAGYALIADGRVFVTVSDTSGIGVFLFALDATSGATIWGPIDVDGGSWPWATAAYDAGRVFVVNTDGDVFAFDARSGAEAWRIDLPVQYSFSSPPTARGGLVYTSGAGSGGTLYAVDQADGSIVWSAPVENGDDSSPAVTETSVFVSYACNQAYAFEPMGGDLLWHHDPDCTGGGGRTVAVHGGRVYARDFVLGNLVLDASDGSETGTFGADAMPAFADGVMYAVAEGALTATPIAGTPGGWSFGGADVRVYGAPLVVGEHVFATAETGLYALARADGSLVSSDPLAGIRTVKTAFVGAPDAALAAADGLLLVPTTTGVVAY